MRILHAPVNSSGQAYFISRAQRKLGHKSDVVVFYQNSLDFIYDKNLKIDKKPIIYRELVMIVNFLACLFHYDVFHFHCGLTLLPWRFDVPILKFFGKTVIMEYWGSDCIQSDVNGYSYNDLTAEEFQKIFPHLDNDKRRKRLAQDIQLMDSMVVGAQSLTPYVPKSEVIFKAIDLEASSFRGGRNKIRPPIIIHAPTNQIIKGTEEIIKVIKELKKRCLKFKFFLIRNKNNEETVQAIRRADIIIDQIRLGDYGTFAVEAMALGKPVICWINTELFKKHLKDCPIVRANKNNLVSELEKLINNSSMRLKIGKQSRHYVEKHHDSKTIAEQFINLYNRVSFKSDDFKILDLNHSDLPYISDPMYQIDYHQSVDKKGITLFKYGGKDYYNPVQIAEKVLFFINNGQIKKAEEHSQKLIDLSQDFNGAMFFPYYFDFLLHKIKSQKMTPPWYSGMAQGEALSVFVKLLKITKKQKYADWAKKVFQSFLSFRGSHKPWICRVDDKLLWIEEYPQEKPAHTLNGFIFALYGLYEYYLLTSDQQCKKLLMGGLTTVKNQIHKFRQSGGISLYCLKHRRKSVHYHKVHINQLKKLYQITGDIYFKEMAEKFYQDYREC